MDSDLLRLILLVLGVILVVGIYLWDRYKRMVRSMPSPAPARRHVEPTMDGAIAADPGDSVDMPEMRVEDRSADDDDPLPPGEFVGEPVVKHRWDASASDSESQVAMDLEFNAHDEGDYLHLDPALMDEVPRLILQVVVIAKGEPFEDQRIREALATVDMRYGDMNIYHRQNDRGQALFSLASMVEPGTFPAKADSEFHTPGLVMFTQLPGVQDGLAIYSDMLFTAERLAAMLNAELRDETRSVLTKQTIEHTREKILEHRRKIQMLRRRH
jgi:cell division protein ZipA